MSNAYRDAPPENPKDRVLDRIARAAFALNGKEFKLDRLKSFSLYFYGSDDGCRYEASLGPGFVKAAGFGDTIAEACDDLAVVLERQIEAARKILREGGT